MEKGDRVEITVAEQRFFEIGDKATLTRQDDAGNWHADFDERAWTDPDDHEFCIQDGIAECKLIGKEE